MIIHSVIFWGWLFFMGSLIGSFLNVCIYRLPREQSIVFPRSRCPHCEHQIAWYDNVPLVSFLILGAKCRHCKKAIRWRYPLVEVIAGITTIVVLKYFGINAVGFVYLSFVFSLIVISFVDLDFQIIPDEISVGGLVVGLILSFLIPELHAADSRWISLGRSIIGFLAGGGILYGMAIIGDFIFRKETMGGGDIKLLAMAGSILGWKLVLLTFIIAPLFAIIPGLFVLLLKKSHVIPYGPFLSIALIVSLFFGQEILDYSQIEESVRFLLEYHGWT